jgi:hypothetical protein
MIEKSPDVKLYEQADLFVDGFRDAVRSAQKQAQQAGIEYVFVVNGRKYIAKPDGAITQQDTKNAE